MKNLVVTLSLLLAAVGFAEDISSTFDFSGIAAPSGCSGAVVSFGAPASAQALMMTNAHCVGMLSVPVDTVFRDKPYRTNVKLHQDRDHTQAVATQRILWSAISMNDLALVELNKTYEQLEALGIKARRVSKTALSEGGEIVMASGYFRTATQCKILGVIPFIQEDNYRNVNSYKYRECDARHGTSGSPLISAATGEIVGVNYTGNDSGERCTFNNPCEVDDRGNITVDKGAGYGDPVHQMWTCINDDHMLDLDRPGCQLFH